LNETAGIEDQWIFMGRRFMSYKGFAIMASFHDFCSSIILIHFAERITA